MRSSDIVLVAAHPLNSDSSGHRTSPWCRYSMNPSASTPSRTVADHFVGRWTDEEVLSLDGYASAVVWPGWWGLQGPEYLAWLGEQPEVTYLMGADTYRLMSGFAAGEPPAGQDDFAVDEEASVDELRGRRRWCSLRRSTSRSRGRIPRSSATMRSKLSRR